LRQQVAIFNLGKGSAHVVEKTDRAAHKKASRAPKKRTSATRAGNKDSVAANKTQQPDFPKSGTVENDDVWEEF